MIEMMILLSNSVDTETILDRLKRSIAEWQINQSDENLKRIEFHSHLFLLKNCRESDDESGKKLISEIRTFGGIMDRFKATN